MEAYPIGGGQRQTAGPDDFAQRLDAHPAIGDELAELSALLQAHGAAAKVWQPPGLAGFCCGLSVAALIQSANGGGHLKCPYDLRLLPPAANWRNRPKAAGGGRAGRVCKRRSC